MSTEPQMKVHSLLELRRHLRISEDASVISVIVLQMDVDLVLLAKHEEQLGWQHRLWYLLHADAVCPSYAAPKRRKTW